MYLSYQKTEDTVARLKNNCIFASAIVLYAWPVRLGVRTPGFHPGNRGSIPLRATKIIQQRIYLPLWQIISQQ